ncbi:MAG: MATE family efflux transporter [Coxiellaceae bacterium]|nr:MATE family efflux transporter [Coxiellaceae bacterium]
MLLSSKTQLKRVIALSLPMAGSRFLQMLSGFISTMMVAHLGKTILAACALIGATLTPILMIFISIVFSLSFIVGQSFGAKKYSEIGALVQQGALLSLILGVLMMICCWFADTALYWFHEDPAKLVYVRQYFHILMWGAIPILLQSCLEQFFYGVLKQRIVVVINFLSVLIGIPIAYCFIFGKFGMPQLGVGGLALTFVIQACFGFSSLLLCVCFKSDFLKFEVFKKRSHTGLIYLRQIFRIGWPMSVQFGGELGAFFVVTMMIGWLGTDALAATQVVQQWMFLVIVPIFAMSEASGILVGQSVGAREFSHLNTIARASLILSLGLVLLIDFGFVFFPHFFVSFYMDATSAKNAGVLTLVPQLFLLMAITLIFNSIRDVITGSLRGLFDTQFPMQIGLFVMWCLVLPLGYFFAFTLHLNVIGFRIGGNIGLLIGAVIIYWRWRVKLRGYGPVL